VFAPAAIDLSRLTFLTDVLLVCYPTECLDLKDMSSDVVRYVRRSGETRRLIIPGIELSNFILLGWSIVQNECFELTVSQTSGFWPHVAST
jgi:hypothetical protein